MSDNQTEAVEARSAGLQHAPDWDGIIRDALDKGPDAVAALERIEGMMIRANERNAVTAFNHDRLHIIANLPEIRRNKEVVHNDGFRFYYSDLEELERVVIEAGAIKRGFSWYWDMEIVDGKWYSVCHLCHDSGHERVSRFPMEPDTRANKKLSETQKNHVASSMADRISFMRVWGLVALTSQEESDAPKPDHETVTEDEALRLEAALRQYVEQGGGDEKAVEEAFKSWQNWAGVRSFSDWPKAKYKPAMERIAQRVKELEATK